MDGILKYSVPEEREDYVIPEDPSAMDIDPQLLGGDDTPPNRKLKSNLRLPPPPLFSRQEIPQIYKYVPMLITLNLSNQGAVQLQSKYRVYCCHYCG